MAHKNNQNAWWQEGLSLFFQLSGWLAIPIIIALYLGEWLDKKYHTEPWLFLSCIGAAFLISMVGLIRNTLAEYKKIEQASQACLSGRQAKKEK